MKEVYEAFGLTCKDSIPNRNAFDIETNKGRKCLKERKFREKEYEFILAAIEHLRNSGFSYVPHYIKTAEGELYYKKDDRIYIICDWIESRNANFMDPRDLIQATETLSKLHRASFGFHFEEVPAHKMVYGRWIEKFTRRCEEIQSFCKIAEEKEEKTYFDELYMQYAQEYYEQGCLAIERLNQSGYHQYSMERKKMGGFCHHDTAHHNFLITPQQECFMIDFDYCICDTHLHDLSSIIIRNNKHLHWDIAKAYFILEIYKKQIPIEEEELEIMKGFITFPQDFWQIGLQYYVENQPWDFKSFITRLRRFLKHREDRGIFLDAFLDVLTGI